MLKSNRVEFSRLSKAIATSLFSAIRKTIKLSDDAIAGPRFRDNVTVLAILESMFTEQEFTVYPHTAAEASLREAAETDHWYEFSKDYAETYFYEDEGTEEEYE